MAKKLYDGMMIDYDLSQSDKEYMFTYNGVDVYNTTGADVTPDLVKMLIVGIDDRFDTPIILCKHTDKDFGELINLIADDPNEPAYGVRDDCIRKDIALPGGHTGITFISNNSEKFTDEELLDIWLTAAGINENLLPSEPPEINTALFI